MIALAPSPPRATKGSVLQIPLFVFEMWLTVVGATCLWLIGTGLVVGSFFNGTWKELVR